MADWEIFTLDRFLLLGLSLVLAFMLAVVITKLRYMQKHLQRNIDHEVELNGLQMEKAMGQQIVERDLTITRLSTEKEQLHSRIKTLSDENAILRKLKDEYIQQRARSSEKERSLREQEEALQQAKDILFKEFENSANRLFEAKQQVFEKQSRVSVETVLKPFREQLKDFGERVNRVYDQESSQRNQLVGHIIELQKQTLRIGSEADNLAKALKGDNKLQGNWGELILERVLEQSGLVKGREYETQVPLKGPDGKNFRPDAVIRLPDNKDIVIDAKVSLLEYEKFCSAENPAEQEQALKRHLESIRQHIKMLSLKQYEQLEGLNALDFVFIFIPIEAAFNLAVQHKLDVVHDAADKRILLVSPTSIIVALRTVESLWRQHRQNHNAEKIALSAGRLYDQFVLVMNAFEELGGNLRKASVSYNQLLNRLAHGRGNVLKKVSELKQLGAKTSRELPDSRDLTDLDTFFNTTFEQEDTEEL